MQCEYCRAPIQDTGAFCSHCGTRISRPPRGRSESTTDPARYDLVEANPGYPIARRYQPPVSTASGIAVPLVMAAIPLIFILFVARTLSSFSEAPHGFAVPFYAIPAIMIVVMGVAAARGLRYHRAPIHSAVLVVVDERTKVSNRGGRADTVSTTYFATLQARSGERSEYEMSDLLAGRIAPGDIGVAYLKADRLVDFRRFDA